MQSVADCMQEVEELEDHYNYNYNYFYPSLENNEADGRTRAFSESEM